MHLSARNGNSTTFYQRRDIIYDTDLHTLLGQISAGPVIELYHNKPIAEGFDGTFHSHNTPGTFS